MSENLSHGSLYHNLSKELREYIHRVGEVYSYNKGEVIFLESEEAHHFYLILEGTVKISRLSRDGKEVLLALLSAGNFFGEMALLDGFPRSADATAGDMAKLLKIYEKYFYYLIENTSDLAIEVLIEIAYRIRNSDSQIKGLSILNARGKVASTLLRWAQDQGSVNLKKVEIPGIPRQQEMANYVGLSRETFNRVLADLENEGFIDKSDVQKIVIKNFPEFKFFFGSFY